jgi:hypothetical protein
MKTHIVVVLVSLVMTFPSLNGASRDAQWKEVEEAMNQGRPRTALEKLTPIVDSSVSERAWAEATRAITQRVVLESEIEGGRPEEKILRMQQEIERASGEIVPLLRAVHAHWYWQYFKQNRWRFIQRTATGEPPGS